MDTNRSIRNMVRVLFIVLTLLSCNLAYNQDAYALTINSGASYTSTPNVTLQLNSNPYVYQVAISNEGGTATTLGPSSPILWALSTGEGFKTVNVTYSYSQPYTCQVACGSYCCGGYTWTGSCRGYCTQYCNSTCYTNGSYSESATITIDARSINTGTSPVATATNPVTNRIYVVNQGSDTVTVIDGATNTTATVAVGSSPQAIAVNPVSNKVYVANQNSTVTVIDGATNSPATIGISGTPVAIAVNSITNKIYVANQGSNTITVIDGTTGIPFATIGISGIPAAIGINPSTNRIYVANQGSNSLTIIDGTNNSTTTIGISGIPIGIAVNPVTNRIYVANQGSNTVAVIDGETGTQTALIEAAGIPASIAVNTVTNRIYVANQGSNTLTVIDGSNNSSDIISVGTPPYSVSVNPVTNKIYVANYASNNITVIDGTTNATASVSAGVNPCAIGINPVTNKVYVLNKGSGNVIQIDGATNSTTTVTVGGNPHDFVVNPVTNKIYVANRSGTTVTVIDGATNSTTSVTVGTLPTAVAVNPITNKIYVANEISNNVTVIDGATTETTTVAVGTSPSAVAVNPVTNKVYVANQGSSNITVIDGATNEATTVVVGTNPSSVAVNPASNKVYVVNQGSNNVTVIDGATNSTTAVVSTGETPFAIAVNPVTNKVYVTNINSSNVTVIDGATNGTTTATVGTSPWAVTINPVTNKIYVANAGSSNVTVIDGATNTTTTVAVGTSPYAVVANPVSNKIYVANQGSSNVTVIDGATKNTTTVVTEINPHVMAVNPVTNKIYVAHDSSFYVTVITGQQSQTNPLTTAITPLTGNTTNSSTPSFTLTPTNGFTPNSTGEVTAYYQLDTWQGPWLKTLPTPVLTPGIHTLYAFAADAQAATSTNTGPQSSPLIGTMAAYQFLVVPNSPPVITEGASSSVSMSKDGIPTTFSLTLHASDANSDTLTWSISSAAINGTATASGTGVSKSIAYTPNVGYVGADSFIVQVDDGIGGVANISVNITLNQTYTVSFVSDSNGTLSGTTSQTIDSGTSTSQMTAVPDSDYHFANWTGSNGFATTTTNPLNVSNITSDMTITANFAINTYNISASPGINGSLDGSTPSPTTMNHGSTTSFKFNADSGYYVSSVSGCSGSAYTNSDQNIDSYTYTSGAIAGTCTVSAAFTLKSTTGPTFSSASFFGDTGDEHGTGIAITNGVLFTVGYGGNGGILARYAVPPDSTPSWSAAWPNQGGNDNFLGVAVTSSNVYTAGSNYNRTSDSGGDKEPKGLVAQFLLTGATGTGLGGSVWDVQTPAAPGAFPYSGYEGLNAILNTVEASNDYIYATGLAQINGSSGRLFLSKLNTAGTILWTVNDSVEMLSSGYNRGLGLAALNNYIYVAGASHDSGTDQPYIRKYDQNGTLVWSKISTLSGSYQGVTAFGGAIYAVGQSSSLNFLIEKWDESGNVLWTKQYDRNSAEDILNGVTGLGSSIFAAGSTKGSTAGGSDAALLQIDPATGNLLSTTLWGGAQDDAATGITTDGQDLYLIGNTASFGTGGIDMVLLRYTVPKAVLSSTKTGTGSGTMTSTPAGIDCGATCSDSFPVGTLIILTTTADPGSTFGGWSGSGCTGTGTCVVTMDDAKNVTATFVQNTQLLTLNRAGTGTGTVSASPAGTSGTPHNGTLINSPNWTSGKFGNGLSLSSGQYVAVPAPAPDIFNITGDLTIAMWINPNTVACSGADPAYALLSKRSTNHATPYEFYIGCGGSLILHYWGTNIQYPGFAATGTVTSGAWQHVAVTRSFSGTNATVTFYINGVEAGSSTQNTGPAQGSSDPVWISRDGYHTGYTSQGSYSGLMDEVQIYNRAVSASETAQMYANNSASVANRVGNWKLDETTGTSASDTVLLYCTGTCSEVYNSGSVVTIAAIPTAGSSFAGWSGNADCSDSSVSMDADKTCTAIFNPDTTLLTTSKNGSGSGTITSSPAGIDCGSACSASFTPGSVIGLTAKPDSGSIFTGWGGNPDCSDGSVTMDTPQSCSAIFESYAFTTVPASYNFGTQDVEDPVQSSVTFTITNARSEYRRLVSILLTGADSGDFVIPIDTCSNFDFGPTGYCTALVKFVPQSAGPKTAALRLTSNDPLTPVIDVILLGTGVLAQRNLTITKAGTGSGTVTSIPSGINCGPTCSASFDLGSPVILLQLPNGSSGFGGWSDACSGTGDCAFSMSTDRSVSANFTISPMVKNQRTSVAYSNLQTAYTDAQYGDTIMALNTLPTAGLILDAAKSLTIEGGYTSDYASCLGLTPILGPVNIKNLTRVSGLAIRTPASSNKAITAFSFANPVATGVIDEETHTIAVTVPSGTAVTALVPTIFHTGTEISPAAGVPQDFTNPVTYLVTAEDLTTQIYTATVVVAPWAVCGDVLTYAGENYPTVQIGSQCWFARSLNIGSFVTVTSAPDTSCTSIQKFCYDNNESNCTTYGGLYTWTQSMCGATAEKAQGLCLAGWHVPSDAEFVTLANYLGSGGCTVKPGGNYPNTFCGIPAGDQLKAAGFCQGRTPCGDSGFNALLGGYFGYSAGPVFGSIADQGSFWTSSMANSTEAWRRGVALDYSGVDGSYFWTNITGGRSIRCLKD